jgi:hypothetical protein
MERYLMFSGDLADFPDRLDAADLVVGVHDRDQGSPGSYGLSHLIGIDDSVLIGREPGHLEALFFQSLDCVHDGKMLYGRGYEVIATGMVGMHDPFEGKIIRFGTSGDEYHLLRGRIDQSGNLFPRPVYCVGGLFPNAVHARRVSKFFLQEGHHCIDHFR